MQLTYRGCPYQLNSQSADINLDNRLAIYRGVAYRLTAPTAIAMLNPTQLIYRGVAYVPSSKKSMVQSIDSLSPWIA